MCPLFPARQAALAVIQTLALSVPTSPSAFHASIPYIVQLLDKLTADPRAYRFTGWSQGPIEAHFGWKKRREWMANRPRVSECALPVHVAPKSRTWFVIEEGR